MKTQEEIQKEIKALKAIRPKVRPFSYFGDDNLAKLDAQVKVLEEDMDSDDIWNEWPKAEEDALIRLTADDARNWMDDASDVDSLADEWPLEENSEEM